MSQTIDPAAEAPFSGLDQSHGRASCPADFTGLAVVRLVAGPRQLGPTSTLGRALCSASTLSTEFGS